jgi:hypothetical protein
MDNVSFGVAVTVVGMGGTLLTLWMTSVIVTLLKKLFPVGEADLASKKEV